MPTPKLPLRALCALFLAGTLLAHDPGLSASRLRVGPTGPELELTFHSGDVAAAAGGDRDGNGALDAAEIAAHADALRAWLLAGCRVRADGHLLPLLRVEVLPGEEADVRFTGSMPPITGALALELPLLRKLPRGHRHYAAIVRADGTVRAEGLLHGGIHRLAATIDDAGTSHPAGASAGEWLWLGIEHILIGYDHILFLLALLLAGGTLRSLVAAITAFTVAHSVTLGLATLDLVRLPGALVEAVIAASIVWVALRNLRGHGQHGRVPTTLGFGLVHGFGFASVLRDLGIAESGGVTVPLLCFNGGVELGQLAIAVVVVPLLALVQRRPALRARLLPCASLAVAAMGTFWLLERTLLWVGTA